VTNGDSGAAASDDGMHLQAALGGEAANGSEAAASVQSSELSRPEHAMFFHWLPWVLPLGAIALPEIILVILGTGLAKHMTTDLAAESVDRGDLLIPVIISARKHSVAGGRQNSITLASLRAQDSLQ
jgi:hypothetical protein